MGQAMEISANMARAEAAPPFLADAALPAVPASVTEPASSLDACLEQLQGQREIFRPGEVIFREGETADKICRVLDGTIRLCRYAHDGRRSIVSFLAGGDLMGLEENPLRPVSAEAVEETSLIAGKRRINRRTKLLGPAGPWMELWVPPAPP
jgi:CRP-like cAMP-binding protein